MTEEPLRCKNMKVIFKGDIENKKKYDKAKKRGILKNGYTILKIQNIVFTFYRTSEKIINCTGIQCIQDLTFVKKYVREKIGFAYNICKVNNSLFSFKIKSRSIPSFLVYFEDFPFKSYFYKYQASTFPGIFYKSRNKQFPTAILFSTGKILIIGGKNIDMITQLYEYLLKMPCQKKLA